MNAEIIAIGSELLLGEIVNSNAAYLSRQLASLGIDVYFHNVVGDNPQRLYQQFALSLSRADLVITTGGLGPTVDDITAQVVCEIFGRKLTYQPQIAKKIRCHFQKRKIKMPQNNLRQAYLPAAAKILSNPVGTAPGFLLRENRKTFVCLPGVPFEMQPMFEKQVIPYLKKNFKLTSCLYSKIVKIVGLPESAVNARVKDLLKLKPPLTVGIYAHAGEIDLRINAKAASEKGAAKMMAPVIGKIQKRFAINVSSLDGEPLEKIVGELLARQKKTLAVAESCTGGLISSRLTDMSGSSRYFLMGEIVYSNRIKIERLGISPELLKKSGAVSSLVALRLAENIRKIAKSDFGLSASGIAGPSGATKTKPVGLVYIGFSSKNKTYAKEFHFLGNRTQIKYKTSQAALDMLRRELIS